jgi:hypothetical protein
MAIYEIAIAVADRGPGRVQEGDIVSARLPLGHIVQKEGKNLLWLLVDTELTPNELTAAGVGSKRKYNVPLESLDGIDLGRVRDINDEYQPLLKSAAVELSAKLVDRDR